MDNQIAYETFWRQLLPAYPISRGNLRLPIATTMSELPNLQLKSKLDQLEQIIISVIREHGSQSKAVTRATRAGEGHLNPLITDEYSGVIRFDCVYNQATGEIKILEMNCDYPDGLVLHDKTISALSKSKNNLHSALLRDLFGKDEPVTTFYDERAVFLDGYHAEHESLKDSCRESHITSQTCEIPNSHTIRRCLETTKFSRSFVEHLAVTRARVVNTIALRTLGYKDLLETINHPFIPETYALSDSTKDYFMRDRERWVLKPSDGCEGYGIYFGKNHDTEEWRQLLSKNIQKNYIVQEYVAIPQTEISLYEDETIIQKKAYFDLCPHFFIKDGHVIGRGHTLMRYSANPVVNVMQGGGIGYHKS